MVLEGSGTVATCYLCPSCVQCHFLFPMEFDDNFSIADSRTERPKSWFFPLQGLNRVLSSPRGGVRSEMLTLTSCLGCVGTTQPWTFCWCVCLDWLLGRLHLVLPSCRGVCIFWLPVALGCSSSSMEVWDRTEVESNLFTSVIHAVWSRDLSPALQRDLCGQVGSCTCPAVHPFGEQGFFSN